MKGRGEAKHKDGTLGIIGCYSLSDQIIYLVDRDDSIESLFVVNNEEGLRFIKKLHDRSVEKNVVFVDEKEPIPKESTGFSILLWLNPGDLHNESSSIRQRQTEILERISDHVDSVLFCYGLCRSPEERIACLIREARVPVTFLTDSSGEIVDDCFAAIIGGKQAYLDHIKEHKGTIFASTGYVETWGGKYRGMDIESIVEHVEGMTCMFEAMGYHQVMALDDGQGDRDLFDKDIRTFARIFDLRLVIKECCLKVFEQSYDHAKEKIDHGEVTEMEETPWMRARPSLPQSEALAYCFDEAEPDPMCPDPEPSSVFNMVKVGDELPSRTGHLGTDETRRIGNPEDRSY